MKKQRAGIYERRGSMFITAALQTEDGLWIEQGPCTRLSSQSPPDEVGRVVLETLSRSGAIIPHPTEWKGVDDDNPVLQAAGIKRWNTFRKGTRTVEIGLYGDQLIITPTRNEGREGFAHLPNDLILPATATATELGEAVNQTLAMCK